MLLEGVAVDAAFQAPVAGTRDWHELEYLQRRADESLLIVGFLLHWIAGGRLVGVPLVAMWHLLMFAFAPTEVAVALIALESRATRR